MLLDFKVKGLTALNRAWEILFYDRNEMKKNFLLDPSYTPYFSGHDTFPLRQLWLQKAVNAIQSLSGTVNHEIFSDDRAIVRFGVGKNMVNAIKHWSLACGVLTQKEDGQYILTEMGKSLFSEDGFDHYGESIATTWLLHWILSGQGQRSTTWFFLFNHINAQFFDRQAVLDELQDLLKKRGGRIPTETTLKRDIDCCIRSYIPRAHSDSLEDVAEPLLGELGLLEAGGNGYFYFRRGPQHTLPDEVFFFALVEYWKKFSSHTSTLAFESIAHEFGSPGRVFKLDEESVAMRLSRLDSVTDGTLLWSETAGMRQVICGSNKNLQSLNPLDILRKAYV